MLCCASKSGSCFFVSFLFEYKYSSNYFIFSCCCCCCRCCRWQYVQVRGSEWKKRTYWFIRQLVRSGILNRFFLYIFCCILWRFFCLFLYRLSIYIIMCIFGFWCTLPCVLVTRQLFFSYIRVGGMFSFYLNCRLLSNI